MFRVEKFILLIVPVILIGLVGYLVYIRDRSDANDPGQVDKGAKVKERKQNKSKQPLKLPRCNIVPLAKHQVSLQIDSVEKIRWHFGQEYPRPFFFPLNGPSGTPLTRMGHPGAPNHDHHVSIWFAHHKVNGLDFWSNNSGTRIRQKKWYCYQDGEGEAVIATVSGWYDHDGKELMEQDIVTALIPLAHGEHAIEIQITMRPSTQRASIELGKTNFGILAVRVSKTISTYFGSGKLTDSEGREGEPNIFGKRARWVDYSGPIAIGKGSDRTTTIEGITYFDHPINARYPTHWHVRGDGWMCASFCMKKGLKITKDRPLKLRYLLYAHKGSYDHAKSKATHKAFASRCPFVIQRSKKKNHQFQVERNLSAQ